MRLIWAGRAVAIDVEIINEVIVQYVISNVEVVKYRVIL